MISQLSIVIPTLNEEKYLPKLLNSLQNQTHTGKLEIIVVDGKSTDKTREVIRQFQQTLPNLSVYEINKNIGAQRNFGAKKASFHHILFLDADMILPPHFLASFLPKVPPQERTLAVTLCLAAEFDFFSTLIIAILAPVGILFCLFGHYAPGFFLFTTKENHEKLNGFRTDLLIAEDIDYARRSYANGASYHFYFSPLAYHSVRRIRKMGPLPFLVFYLKGIYGLWRYGIEYFTKDITYPFGHY